MAAAEHLHRYFGPPSLAETDRGFAPELAAELGEGRQTSFLIGDLLNPMTTAKNLRAVMDLVATRSYIPRRKVQHRP